MGVELRWSVVVADLDPTVGTEIQKKRRCLVVSYEAFHRSGLMMTVCPISAARALPRYPNEVAIPAGVAGQTEAGVIICYQVRTISIQRLEPTIIGTVTDPHIRGAVRQALAIQLGLNIPCSSDGALSSGQFQ